MKIAHTKFVLLCSALLSVLLALPAAAQVLLEEVIVTAQKREESLQDVGIAITSFSGEQMRALGVEESFDVARFSPGVHISGNLAGQNTQFSIRGVTQNDFNDIIESPNAVYLDEGYIAVAQAHTFAVFDIDRVEILKGPQGTLFGRNATGGLVHYISRKPNFEEVEGYADGTIGVFDSPTDATSYRFEAAVSGPFSDKAAGRVAVYYSKHDGYLENIYPFAEFGAGTFGGGTGNSPGAGAGADMGDDDTKAIRGMLQFQPSDRTEITFSANYAESEVATGPYQSKATIGVFDGVNGVGELINVIDVTDPNETRTGIAADGSDFGGDADNDGLFGIQDPGGDLLGRFGAGGDFFGYIDPDGDGWTTSGDFAFDDNGSTETTGLNFRVEHTLANDMLFTSVTDWKDYEKLLFIDVDSAPVNQLANYAGVDADSFTQEFRLTGSTDTSNWVIGFYYLNIDSNSDNGLKGPANSLPALLDGLFPFPQGVDIGVEATLKTDSYSLFGQYEWNLSDTVTLITGLRVIQEEKDYRMRQGFYFNEGNFSVNVGDPYINIRRDFLGLGEYYEDDRSDTLWAGKLQLNWEPSDDLLLYAGLNRGVKAASYNAPIPGGLGFPDSFLPYDEEILHSLEAGFKKTLAGGRTRIQFDAFYYDYSDYQAFLFTGVSGVVVNADADNYGFEFQVQSSPADGWDIVFGLSWMDATVKDVPLRINSPLPSRDVDPTYAPEFQASGLVRYGWNALGGEMAVSVDGSYSDEYFYNLRNFDADKFDSYFLLNLRWSWLSGDGRWEVALVGHNLTDEAAGIQGFDLATLCGCNEVSYQPPRWYGFNVRINF
ncbi:TonB-dependent receptor [Elongatibacter sediminis]|uniref:TonB-dependent receptor n=1 Tax=Elongatibacter sediminis TaxID=3119006 RepID=A0AAW9R9K6_9GAMM